MGEVGETEAWVRSREFFVDNNGGHRVHAGATVLGRHGDAQQPEGTELAKQGQVETLLPVMFQSLRFNLFAYEVAYSLAQQRVFFTRVEKIIGWHRHLLSILGSWRSLCILSKQMCAVNCGCAGVTGELPLRAEPTVAQVEA